MSAWIRTASVALAILALASCGRGATGSDSTPGYDDSNRTPDTRPFTMVLPGEDTPTTLPEGVFSGETTTTFPPPTTTPTIPPTTTTTTAVLPIPGAPAASTITNICGFSTYVSSFYGLSTELPDHAEVLMGELMATLDQVIVVAPEDLKLDVTVVRDRFREMEAVLRQVGWDAASRRYVQAVEALETETEPGGFIERLHRIVRTEQETCG